MRSPQKQQKTSAQQTLLDEYLALKPHRAVDRILTQNDLTYCIELYNLLQQNVKNNTNQLRSVLYNKHENLHQCSQMIGKIEEFSSKVKNIQEDIDSCLRAPFVEDDWKLGIRTEMNPLQKIQQLMNEKQFSAALKECKQTLVAYSENNLMESDTDAYYLNFLKVEIIQKLQENLQNTPLMSQLISEAISALSLFMDVTPVQSLIEYIQQNVVPVSQGVINSAIAQKENVSILELLYETSVESNDVEGSYPLSQDKVIEVIFKFKLLSIKQTSVLGSYETTQHKIQHLYGKVFNYFSDLLQILNQVEKKCIEEKAESNEGRKSDKRGKLYKIFTLNIQKTVNHISELFITNHKGPNSEAKESSGTLTFESELYEKLLDSKQFLDKLNALSQHFRKISQMSKDYHDQEIDLVGIIKNLWRDFYHQMLEIISQKINPSKWHTIPHEDSLTQELSIFSVTQFSKITAEKVSQYQKELEIFKSNFSELLHKSKTIEEKQAIVSYFIELQDKIVLGSIQQVKTKSEIIQTLKQRKNRQNKKKAEHQIRELLLMYFITQLYNLSWTDQKEDSLPCMVKQIHQNTLNTEQFSILLFNKIDQNSQLYQIVDTYLDLRIEPHKINRPEYIQRWQQQLDLLFGSYSVVVRHQQTLKDPLKQLILALIKTKLHLLETK